MVTINIQTTESGPTFNEKTAAIKITTPVSQNHFSAIGKAFEAHFGAKAQIGAYGVLRDAGGNPIVNVFSPDAQKTLYGTVAVAGIENPLAWIAQVSGDESLEAATCEDCRLPLHWPPEADCSTPEVHTFGKQKV